jgi:membrane protein implicated in regulation of membrane protease activity
MNMMAIIWLALLIVFVILEAATVQLISTWFAVGALAAMVTTLLTDVLWLQIVVFFLVSTLLLMLLRPLARMLTSTKKTATNVDSVIGKTGVVLEDIDNLVPAGQVKLDAMVWTARSTAGDKIPAGTVVKVDRVEGVKIYVTEV